MAFLFYISSCHIHQITHYVKFVLINTTSESIRDLSNSLTILYLDQYQRNHFHRLRISKCWIMIMTFNANCWYLWLVQSFKQHLLCVHIIQGLSHSFPFLFLWPHIGSVSLTSGKQVRKQWNERKSGLIITSHFMEFFYTIEWWRIWKSKVKLRW